MATIRDVARMAGVSISTVSHVVNKTRYVSPELVERVEQAIAGLDTPPNFIIKKSMAYRDPAAMRYIALINLCGSNPKLEAALRRQARKANLSLIAAPGQSEAELDACGQLLSLPGCAGALYLTGERTGGLPPDLIKQDLPQVVLGSQKISGIPCVFPDMAEGTRQAVLHLLRSGHEQIAFLGSSQPEGNCVLTGYREALARFGVPYSSHLVRTGLEDEQAVTDAMDALFDLPQPPTALYAATGDVVIPLFRYLQANNICCPKDVSVICLGDFDWAPLHSPAITAVHASNSSWAAQAVQCLLGQIPGRPGDFEETKGPEPLHAKLILRASTAGIARGPFGEKAETPEHLQLTTSETDEILRGKYTAAISFHYMGKSYMELIVKGMTDVFKGLGIHIIATTDAHFDPALQCRQLESLGLLKPDIVVGIPTDDTLTADAFRTLIGHSKLIFVGHVPIGFQRENYVSCISVDDRAYGQYIAQSLVENMQRLNLRHTGMLMRGGRFFSTNQRDAAAEQLLSERSNIQICGAAYFDQESSAYGATLELMREHPEIEGIYVSWEGPALEAMRALQELGRTDVIIATGDLEYQSAQVLASGGMIKGIAAQRPYEQGQAVAMAAAISLLGRKVPTYITVEPTKITPANLLRAWKEIYWEDAPAELKANLRKIPDYMGQPAE